MDSVALAASPSDRGFLMVLLATAVVGAVAAVYSSSVSGIVSLWNLSAYRHCALVIPGALYLVWRQRSAFADVSLYPSVAGVALLATIVLAWVVARAVALQGAEHLATIAMVPATMLALTGRAAFLRIGFPMLFLLAAAPVGEELEPLLMQSTAAIAHGLLASIGVPVFRQGQVFSLPGGDFVVADVCAGVRYLLAGLVTAALYSYFAFGATYKRLLFIAIAALVYIAGNGVRAFIVMAVASATQMRVLGGADHIYFGHGLFAVLTLALLWSASRFAEPRAPTTAAATTARPVGRPTLSEALLVAVALAILRAGPAIDDVKARVDSDVGAVVRALPAVAGCAGPEKWAPSWLPAFAGADAQVSGTYQCGEAAVSVAEAAYVRQHQGKKAIRVRSAVLPQDDRFTPDTRLLDLGPDRHNASVAETEFATASGMTLAWTWYAVNGEPTSCRLCVKALEAKYAILMRPGVSVVLVVTGAYRTDADLARIRPAMSDVARAVWLASSQTGP